MLAKQSETHLGSGAAALSSQQELAGEKMIDLQLCPCDRLQGITLYNVDNPQIVLKLTSIHAK